MLGNQAKPNRQQQQKTQILIMVNIDAKILVLSLFQKDNFIA